MAEMMGAIFNAEPLTEEQEARLPAAGAVAAALVPEGVYARMMRDMMDGTLGGIFDMAVDESDAMSSLDLADYTGLYGQEVEELTEEQRRELTRIFDPVYQERIASDMAEMTALMERVFDRLEPGLRDGLSRALATRFSDGELEAIDAFFSTPAGAKYAGESLIMFSDPQVMASVGQAMPTLMEEMSGLFDGQSGAADGLPEPRGYDDLTPSEQRRASEILGVDQDMLRVSMTSADPAQEAPAVDAAASLEDDAEAPAEQGESFEEAMEEIGAE
ncbi:DUF2059 domain-containing protein [Alteriqipengyuania sp. 357]